MTSRGGRYRRESSERGSNAASSRHLWVGNLAHTITEDELLSEFSRFGEVDTAAFQRGRSYAFINYKKERDAVDAMQCLQGFSVAGNPLRIEFAKADKSSTPRNDDFSHRRDEHRSSSRGSPYMQRDSRANVSPDSLYPEKSRAADKNGEPSEVLWIGFPSLLKVDEMILRKAFSPFGDIEKISVFPGRSFAFVRFRNLGSACRAKETLQGKLFGNPRVHICFARSESGSSSGGRTTLSPPLKPHGRSGASENFRPDRNFESLDMKSRRVVSNLDNGDADVYGFKRKGGIYPGESNTFGDRRFGEELGPPRNAYEHSVSPVRERSARFDEYPEKSTQRVPLYEEPWDLPEDPYPFQDAKRLKTGSFPPNREFPEYPLIDPEQEKHVRPRAFSDFGQPEPFDKNFESRPLRPVTDHQSNSYHSRGESNDNWRASHDIFTSGSGSLPSNAMTRKRPTPEPERPSIKLWKWEGTIAKGGTPVCRARSFPVGKSMDMLLPEFLDCTARTGLDMLAKHYYQAASAWVIFFVPADDADIGYYNEFMNYLREKQRAAVTKLDEKTTLFLVPPSDFSEKVLKVPGDMSIAGVVLRLEHPGSNLGPPRYPDDNRNTNSVLFHGDASYQRPSTPSGHLRLMATFPDAAKSGRDPPFVGNVTSFSDAYSENRHDYPSQQRNPMSERSWSPPDPPNIGHGNVPSHISGAIDLAQDSYSILPRAAQESSSKHYAGGIPSNPHPESKPSVPLAITGLQPQQLAQLASSLLGQQTQSGSFLNIPMGEGPRQTSTIAQSDGQFRTAQQMHDLQSNMLRPEISASQIGQLQQLLLQQQQQQQQANNLPISIPPSVRREPQPAAPGNAQMQSSGTHEEGDGDPQKRLQATLQLAASLLQQIQQGKET